MNKGSLMIPSAPEIVGSVCHGGHQEKVGVKVNSGLITAQQSSAR